MAVVLCIEVQRIIAVTPEVHCVPEAACWSEWALPLSFLMTSPTLFSSVCISLLLLCSAPGTSADVRPDPRPLLACAGRRWGAETASSVWAASAGLQVTSEKRWGGGGRCNQSDTPDCCHLSTALYCPQSVKKSIYTLPPAAIPYLATTPKKNIWLCHVPCEPDRGRQEWQSKWVTGLIHQHAHLVKEVSECRFPPPTSTQTNTTRHSQKTCF